MPDDGHREAGAARCPGMSWNDLAAGDTNPVPDYLKRDAYRYLGSEPLPVERYVSPEFFQRELERMWPKVWQFAAREEELPHPGSTVVYENAGRSYLLVRQEDGGVRAFHNVCLHRGRKLRTLNGTVGSFRCPYHGFTWNTDGSLKEIPCRWDFPHLSDEKMQLPEARAALWGGYWFIKEDPGGPELEEFLAPLPEFFARWKHEELYTAAWVAKVVAANWKATAEAFMEAFHSIATHPQILPFTGDCISKYDVFGDNVNLAITPFGVTSPHLGSEPRDQQWVMDNFLKINGRVAAGLGPVQVPQGETARQTMGRVNRARFGEAAGRDFGFVSDAEVQDAFTYNVFPNFAPWGGFQPAIVYRWRPWPDQDHTLMEVRILQRAKPGEKKPDCPPMHLLAADETWASSALSSLGAILDQDWGNLPHVQAGMKASKNRQVQLANYQEVRVRQFHQTLDKYLAG